MLPGLNEIKRMRKTGHAKDLAKKAGFTVNDCEGEAEKIVPGYENAKQIFWLWKISLTEI